MSDQSLSEMPSGLAAAVWEESERRATTVASRLVRRDLGLMTMVDDLRDDDELVMGAIHPGSWRVKLRRDAYIGCCSPFWGEASNSDKQCSHDDILP